ncbi:carotenoid biosynthesis protein [Tunicatimonas pelagia]|uniref:carotenoid biosynthesis protein n=1 Tax=Tunicatimonas pelagia TaxID=931531 RepID=UPI002666A0D4|nr:carotenoid biosynthesis protein [Tunicatimonas pelagia]WKN42883.1 carotenoid biosynthesis protein [Tunicatimonas pelagia]
MNPPIVAKTNLSVKSQQFAAGFLLVAHLAGIIGLAWPVTRPYFQLVTPINLVVSATLLLLFHQQWNRAFVFFLMFTFLLGVGIEVIGVHSEVVFGAYQYGETLGLKVMEVPLVIGVNWFILSYCTGVICSQLSFPPLVKSLLAAIMMVALDFFIEPVAIFFDFWHWEAETVPLRNYLGWLAVAWIMQLAFVYLPFSKKNPLAIYLFMAQLVFFLILGSIV